MRQVHAHRNDLGTIPASSGTSHCCPFGTLFWQTAFSSAAIPWPCSGTFSNLVVSQTLAPGLAASGKGITHTLVINSVDTALTCTIFETALSASDVTHSVSVTAGDLVALKGVCTVGGLSFGSVFAGLEFISSNPGESGYGFEPEVTSTTLTRWCPVFGGDLTFNATSGATVQNVVAAAGSITGFFCSASAAPGAARSYVFNIYKNGVKQDGTAGSVNTTVTLTGAATTTAGGTFTLPVVPGDLVYVECVPVGTPNISRLGFGVRFTATTDGQSQMCGLALGNMSTGAASFMMPDSACGFTWTVEASVITKGIVTSFDLSKMQVVLSGAPGVGKNYTLDVRRNTASPSGTPSVAIADAATTGSDLIGLVTIAAGDSFAIRQSATGTPTARAASWGLIQTTALPIAPATGPNLVPGIRRRRTAIVADRGRIGIANNRWRVADVPPRDRIAIVQRRDR